MDIKIVLLGLDFGSQNLGCAALAYSFLYKLEDISNRINQRIIATLINYNDFVYTGKNVHVDNLKINLKNLSFEKKAIQAIKNADFIFDFTGGDSFTDLYGTKRFLIESYFKELGIKSKGKFILGPQTIGPFSKKTNKIIANHIIRASDMIFCRDKLSRDYVYQEFGVDALQTTDVAFLLPTSDVSIAGLDSCKKGKLNIGINISGLLWHGGYTGNNELGIHLNYRELITQIVEDLIKDEHQIWLIPHVITLDPNSPENDVTPIKYLYERYPKVHYVEEFKSPMDAKGYIRNMDLFIGSRMHATVAAFSNGIPIIPVSYSRKFQGLYQSLGYDYIIDAKTSNNDIAKKQIIEWICNHNILKINVENSLRQVSDLSKTFDNKLIEIFS